MNLAQDENVVYEIDDKDRLVSFNNAWSYFARHNHAAYLAEATILRRSLWDFIVDRETRLIYNIMFHNVRSCAASLAFSYRCDTPTLRRFMNMEISAGENAHIHLVSSLVRAEERVYTPLLDPLVERSTEFLIVCSWCKRFEVAGTEWVEVEDAVASLNIFNTELIPQLSHGICPDCLQDFRHQANNHSKIA